jgi:hypothetical protein
MSDIVDDLATRTGISGDMIQKGLGAVLSFLKEHLGEEQFQQLQSSLPNASSLMSNFETAEGSADGGLLGAISGLVGKLLGGKAGEGAKLLGSLNKLGFDAAQIEAFLPKALEWIKTHLPADVLEKIMAGLPALANLVGSEAQPEA